jgi:hypothetical protein
MHKMSVKVLAGDGYEPQQPGVLVKEHVDHSLFVAEYVPFVRGLEVCLPLETSVAPWSVVIVAYQ